MDIFGITRIGVMTNKTLNSFRATRGKSLAEAKEITFNLGNLSARFNLFDAFCVPTYQMLIAQDATFHALIATNRDLPEPFRSRLERLAQERKNFHVLWLDDDDRPADAAGRKISEISSANNVFTFRYDDDDALPKTYAQMVREAVSKREPDTVLSFHNGFSLSRVGEDQFLFNIRKYPLNAYGIGYKSSLENLRTILHLGSHTKITRPTVHDTDQIGWLSSVHNLNDSRVGAPRVDPISARDVLQQIKPLFPQISIETLQTLQLRRSEDV
ncbi:MAG: glycosyltransferase [Paracoccus sp. (in: a-proteobacteria)]|nr:glycosyltransferase [Paracoccus sp. (in: a-proteobacteria)]